MNACFFVDSSVSCGELKLTVSCSKPSLPLLVEIFHSNIHKTDKLHFRVLKFEGVSPLQLYVFSMCSVFFYDLKYKVCQKINLQTP
jgi:hypothetical protein